jgi:hypothetical protein
MGQPATATKPSEQDNFTKNVLGVDPNAKTATTKPFSELKPLVEKYLKDRNLRAVEKIELEANRDKIWDMYLDTELVEERALTSKGKDKIYDMLIKAKEFAGLVPSLEKESGNLKNPQGLIQLCWSRAQQQRSELAENLKKLMKDLVSTKEVVEKARKAEGEMYKANLATPKEINEKITLTPEEKEALQGAKTSFDEMQGTVTGIQHDMQAQLRVIAGIAETRINNPVPGLSEEFWKALQKKNTEVKDKFLIFLGYLVKIGITIKDLADPKEQAAKVLLHAGGEIGAELLKEAGHGQPKDFTPQIEALGKAVNDVVGRLEGSEKTSIANAETYLKTKAKDLLEAQRNFQKRYSSYAGKIDQLSAKVKSRIPPKYAEVLKAVTTAFMESKAAVTMLEGTTLAPDKVKDCWNQLKPPSGKLNVTQESLDKAMPLLEQVNGLYESAPTIEKLHKEWAEALIGGTPKPK